MTTSEMGFPVTKEREEVQCWRDIVEDRTVSRFLAPVISAYIRGLQGEGAGGECTRMLLSDLESWIGSGAKMIDSRQAIVAVTSAV